MNQNLPIVTFESYDILFILKQVFEILASCDLVQIV